MTSDTNRIEKKIVLRASRARVWRAISDSSEFGRWFGLKVEGPFRPGATMRGIIVPTQADPEVAKLQAPHEGAQFSLVVERIEPEELFSFRWHPYAVDRNRDYSSEPMTLVAFALSDAPGGVLLTVTESGFDGLPLERRAAAFASNEKGWALQMTLIEKYLAQVG
jgi:uncharacterized protein YndB with AHSA1/START domain